MISYTHSFYLVLAAALVTLLLRAMPFLLFRKGGMPSSIKKVADCLPPAIMGVLVIYCLKSAIVTIDMDTLCQLSAVSAVILIHLWKRNTLISIFTGTVIYMILIRIL